MRLSFFFPSCCVFLPEAEMERAPRHGLPCLTVGAAICALLLLIQHQPPGWLEPTIGDICHSHGVHGRARGINGRRPVLLGDGFRICPFRHGHSGRKCSRLCTEAAPGPRASLQSECAYRGLRCSFLRPFSVVYIGLMTSRAGVNMVFDRYLLPLLFFFLLLLARNYQQRVSRQLPRITVAVLAIVAIYSHRRHT